MKSDLETVIQWSKRLESLLEQKLGAVGKGLHGKADSVRGQLADNTLRKLRFVATVRNKLVHEEAYSQLEDRAGFERACADIIRDLENIAEPVRRHVIEETPDGLARRRFSKPKRHRSSNALSFGLSAIGGCAAFAVSILRGGDFVTSLIFGVVGAALGWHWYPALILAALAVGGYAAFRYVPELYEHLQQIRK